MHENPNSTAWKLIGSIDSAKSSAIVYGITETAKANNRNPFYYMEYVRTVMKDHQEDTDYRFMETCFHSLSSCWKFAGAK